MYIACTINTALWPAPESELCNCKQQYCVPKDGIQRLVCSSLTNKNLCCAVDTCGIVRKVAGVGWDAFLFLLDLVLMRLCDLPHFQSSFTACLPYEGASDPQVRT